MATKPFWQEINDATRQPQRRDRRLGCILQARPGERSMGMAAPRAGNSYAEVTVTASQLKVEYKDENGNPLLDSDGTTNDPAPARTSLTG